MAQTLKEKLEALKKKQLTTAATTPPAAVTVPQCSCGSALEGECAECNPPEEPAILERLQKIGAMQGVNPPPDDTLPTAPAKTTTTCPYCEGEFQHLSRHKCRKQPKGAVSPVEAVRLAQLVESGELGTTTVGEATLPGPPTTRKQVKEVIDNPGPSTAVELPAEDFFIALVDVLPLRDVETEMVVFEDIVGPLADAVAKTNQVPHWKMVEYGKGSGQLARLLDDYLQAHPIQGFLLCTTGSVEFQACRSVIHRLARNVMMGTK